MRRKFGSELHRSPLGWCIPFKRRVLAFLLTGILLAAPCLAYARDNTPDTTMEISGNPRCTAGAEKFGAPALEEEAPLPTKGTLVVEGSLILYVCDFAALSRITFFSIHE